MDILLWGATSSTGRVIAAYFLENYGLGSGFTWALGGRNQKKLEDLKSELASQFPEAGKLSIFTADALDEDSLSKLVSKFKVVATTVGPYSAYGEPMVAACAKNGVDYCDLTGEVPFVHKMIEKYHQTAVTSGARIVHSCGFDSIPSDLGTLMVQEESIKTFGNPCSDVQLFVTGMRGSIGGGTAATMIHLFEMSANDSSMRRTLMDPNSLLPRGDYERPIRDDVTIKWSQSLKRWTGPFLMAPFNTRIVRRTNFLLGFKYGRDFQYSEVQSFGKGLSGLATASIMTTGLLSFFGLLAFSFPRKLIARFVMPKPGVGPSKEAMENGFFKMKILGFHRGSDNSPVLKVVGEVADNCDPGHKSTSKMIAESAVYLSQTPKSSSGVLTPAAALGLNFLKRLTRKGMTFSVQVK